jgi:hypothetical protein
MPLTDLNRKIYQLLKELEDLDDEILFGSDRKTLPELLNEERELLKDLEQLYLLQLDLLSKDMESLDLLPDQPQSANNDLIQDV